MKYFKSILFSMFVILVSLTVCGCEYVEKAVDTYDSTQLKVTMIYPSDCVGSAAYCTSFHIGLMSAVSDLGILLTEVNADENDQVSTEVLMREAANNSDLVITAGYQMGDILNRVAPDFPDVNFSIFDVVIDQPRVLTK